MNRAKRRMLNDQIVLQAYNDLVAAGEKVTYQKLADRTEISAPTVWVIIARLGIVFHKKRKPYKQRIRKEKQQQLQSN